MTSADTAWLETVRNDYPRIEIHADIDALQGDESHVVPVRYRGQDGLLKHYEDDELSSAAGKKGRELSFLKAYAETDVVPQVLEHRIPDALLLSRVPGIPMSHYWAEADDEGAVRDLTPHQLREISRRTGLAHTQILSIKVPEVLPVAFQEIYTEGRCFRDYAFSIVSEAERLAAEDATFADPIFHRSVAFVRSRIDAAAEGRPLFYKSEWNLGDLRLGADWDVRFVNFETTYLGTLPVYLGAVADRLTLLDWPSIRRGLEQGLGRALSLRTMETIYAMALYNVWLRIVTTARAGRVGYFDADTLKRRFAKIAADLNVWEAL